MADQQQITELSNQLITAVEQIRACDRQIQLCENQKKKTELVMEEVAKADGKTSIYRSIGRMFVMCTGTEMNEDLTTDLGNITKEQERSTGMKNILETKKDTLTKQLNDLTPKKAQ